MALSDANKSRRIQRLRDAVAHKLGAGWDVAVYDDPGGRAVTLQMTQYGCEDTPDEVRVSYYKLGQIGTTDGCYDWVAGFIVGSHRYGTDRRGER